MEITEYINIQQLMIGDVVVVKKLPYKILDHYMAYIGNASFAARTTDGVEILSLNQLSSLRGKYEAVRIRRFTGTDSDRNGFIKRLTLSYSDSRYNLITLNCEHFANYLQNGTSYSQQSQIVGGATALLGSILIAKSSNKSMKILWAILMIIGLGVFITNIYKGT